MTTGKQFQNGHVFTFEGGGSTRTHSILFVVGKLEPDNYFLGAPERFGQRLHDLAARIQKLQLRNARRAHFHSEAYPCLRHHITFTADAPSSRLLPTRPAQLKKHISSVARRMGRRQAVLERTV